MARRGKLPPLMPATVSCRHLRSMPLDLERFLGSRFVRATDAAAGWAALHLWVQSWWQLPAGSLPDHDATLAALSGAQERWPELRARALHGWIACNDGRLYHPVIVELAAGVLAEEVNHDHRNALAAARMRRYRARKRWGAAAPTRHHVTRNVTHRNHESESESDLTSESLAARARISQAQQRGSAMKEETSSDIPTIVHALMARAGMTMTGAIAVAKAALDPEHPNHEAARAKCSRHNIIVPIEESSS